MTTVNEFEMERNGTFCDANNTLTAMDLNQTLFSCFVKNHPGKQNIFFKWEAFIV